MEFTPNFLCLSLSPTIIPIAQADTVEASQSTQPGESVSLGEEYQKVDYPVLYYHKTTGYYYDPVSLRLWRCKFNYLIVVAVVVVVLVNSAVLCADCQLPGCLWAGRRSAASGGHRRRRGCV